MTAIASEANRTGWSEDRLAYVLLECRRALARSICGPLSARHLPNRRQTFALTSHRRPTGEGFISLRRAPACVQCEPSPCVPGSMHARGFQ
jgi:hypothetical protein